MSFHFSVTMTKMYNSLEPILHKSKSPETGEFTVSYEIRNALIEVFREAFPQEHAVALRDMLLQLTAHSMVIGRNKVILRKLFVAVRLSILFSPFY